MESGDLPSKLYIPRPFASGDGATVTDVKDTESGNINYTEGFPSVYSAPTSSGGKYVKRGDMNAIGNMATNHAFLKAAGGINTFDPSFAAAVANGGRGGYPKGAVLDYLEGNTFYKVISLVENNTKDFRSTGPDHVNWEYADGAHGIVPDYVIDHAVTIAQSSSVGLYTPGGTGLYTNLISWKKIDYSGWVKGFFPAQYDWDKKWLAQINLAIAPKSDTQPTDVDNGIRTDIGRVMLFNNNTMTSMMYPVYAGMWVSVAGYVMSPQGVAVTFTPSITLQLFRM